MQNGDKAPVRADIGMQLVIDAKSYQEIGVMMDAIREAVFTELIRLSAKADFDFTHFNTHPCKSARMAQLAVEQPEYAPTMYAALTQH